jgi:hypothetical protein
MSMRPAPRAPYILHVGVIGALLAGALGGACGPESFKRGRDAGSGGQGGGGGAAGDGGTTADGGGTGGSAGGEGGESGDGGVTPDANGDDGLTDGPETDQSDGGALDGPGEAGPPDGAADGSRCDPMPPIGGANVILNPDFETDSGGPDPTGWGIVFGGGTFLVADVAHCGAHAGQVSGRTAAYHGPAYSLGLPNPGTPTAYTISAWAMHDAPAAQTLRLTVVLQGTNGSCTPTDPSYVPVGVVSNVAPNTWVHITGTATVGAAGCTLARLYLEQADGPPDGGTLPSLFIDDVYANR